MRDQRTSEKPLEQEQDTTTNSTHMLKTREPREKPLEQEQDTTTNSTHMFETREPEKNPWSKNKIQQQTQLTC